MKYFKRYGLPAIVLIIVCVLIVQNFSGSTISLTGYNTDNVYNTIKELSSQKYNGRRYGTPENMAAAAYIEEQFKAIGLEPAGEDNTYLRTYGKSTRSYNGASIMELVDESGSVIKKYRYGDDFIEQGYGYSGPGELTSGYSYMEYDGGNIVDEPKAGNTIAIVKVEQSNQEVMDNLAMALGRENYSALITIVPDNCNLRKETSSIGSKRPNKTGYEIPSFIIKDNIAMELLSYSNKGYKLHVKSTFDSVPGKVADVMGMIPGSGDDYLIISSHLDGVGQVSDGTVYDGALDNASGVGAMIEIARFLKSQGKVPSKNIIFIAFNGTQGGLIGSQGYVFSDMYPLYKTTVINIDMVGGRSGIPLSLLYNTIRGPKGSKDLDPSSKMRYHFMNLGKALGISINEVKDNSTDHVLFTQMGVPAITISDYDKELACTPEDTIDKINKDNIDRAMGFIISFISMWAYSNFSAGGYSMGFQEAQDLVAFLYPLLIALMALVILLYISKRAGREKQETGKLRIPVLSIAAVLILIAIVSYFPIKYIFAPSSSPDILGLMLEGLLSILKSIAIVPIYTAATVIGVLVIFLANKRTLSAKYTGDGGELKYYYYLSVVLVLVLSLFIALIYNTPVYLVVTPDFARHFTGKIVLFVCFGGVSLFMSKLLCSEARIKPRTYGSLIAFAIILFLMLSSFYMPIATNQSVINSNMRNLNIGAAAQVNNR